MRKFCKSCKYFKQTGVVSLVAASWCKHPYNVKFDRVYGYNPPFIRSPRGTLNEDVLATCDKEGLFEAVAKPWWRFWS